MLSLLNRLDGDVRGVSAVEFALFLPLLLVLLGGTLDVGRAIHQAQTLDKALRTGAAYAAHVAEPFSETTRVTVENLVKTGSPERDGAYLISGFSSPNAKVSLASSSYDLDGTAVPVIRISAEVPFDSLFFGRSAPYEAFAFTLRLSHEQAYIGS